MVPSLTNFFFMSATKLLERGKDNMLPPWTDLSSLSATDPMIIESGSGYHVEDRPLDSSREHVSHAFQVGSRRQSRKFRSDLVQRYSCSSLRTGSA